jgi:uncharacterized protein DUF3105
VLIRRRVWGVIRPGLISHQASKAPYPVGVPKKAKTPRPPRTVQAPKRRVDHTTRDAWAGLPRGAWLGGAAGAVAVVIVIVLVTSGGSSATSEAVVAKAMKGAGCTYRTVKPLPPKKDPTGQAGGYHADVPTLTTPTKGLWSSSPPSGGAHYGLWAFWGFYRQPLNPRQVVHNEEHGGIIIWWGPKVPSSTVSKLETFYQQKAEGMVGTPYAALGKQIALTAWTGDSKHTYYQNGYYGLGHIAVCNGFNQKAFATFRDAFRGKGPEGIPLSADAPGSGPQ